MALEVYDDGQRNKPALLLVHGFLSSHRHWDSNIPLAAQFRLIRVDLPAHGASPPPASERDASPDALTAALDRVREALGLERWAICGQSFGAGLTLRYALTNPERITAQIFTNANAALSGPWSPSRVEAQANRLSKIEALGAAALLEFPFHPRHAKRFPPSVRETLIAEAARVDPAGLALLMRHAVPALSVRDRFGETAVPTLLVNGRFERNFQPLRDWAARALASLLVVDLDGGHSLNIERPAAFDAAVLEFLGHHR